MSRSPYVLAFCCALLLIGLVPGARVQAQGSGPSLVTRLSLPESDSAKYPRVAAGNDRKVYFASNPDETVVGFWSKDETASTVSDRLKLGTTVVKSKSDYNNVSVATGPDGAVYVAWISQGSGVYLRRREPNGAWGPLRVVYGNGNFRSYLDIAVASDNRIFVVWNESSSIRYRTSTDNGINWSGGFVTSKTPYGAPSDITAGINGGVIHTHFSSDGKIIVNIWNGSSFSTQTITQGGDFYASPTATVKPNGQYVVAYRKVGGGVYYSERQQDGTWPQSKLAGGEVYGAVAVNSDSQGNLHFFWGSDESGSWKQYYAFKPASGGPPQGPVSVSDDAKLLANSNVAGSIADRAYGHGVVERFTGSGMVTRYFLFAGGNVGPTAQPIINDNALYTGSDTVNVSFQNVSGSPTQIRYKWGSPPTDNASDSNGWQTFTNPLTNVPTPGDTGCVPLRLYTQVRNGTTALGTAQSDDITIDKQINAYVDAENPHLAGLPTTLSQISPQDVAEQKGASDGDPNYTRESQFVLRVVDTGDCSGFAGIRVVESNQIFPPDSDKETVVAASLPQGTTPGNSNLTIRIGDNGGFRQEFTDRVVYDPADLPGLPGAGLPKLTSPTTGSGAATVEDAIPSATGVIRTLKFSNIAVDDNLYGQVSGLRPLAKGQQFWGVWLAVSRTPISDPLNDTTLNWYPREVDTPGPSFLISTSLFSGLSGAARNYGDGKFYVYARFLDGAGNPSKEYISTVVTVPPYANPSAADYDVFAPHVTK